MKSALPLVAAVALLPIVAQAQNVGIGTTTPNTKAALEISATDKGLLIPRLTQAQRLALTSPPQGLMVYQTDGTASGGTQTGFWYYAGTPATWVYLNPAATGDNLGNHTATQNIDLAANQLVGNGGTSGISISSTGNVGVGVGSTAANRPLTIQANSGGDLFQLRNNTGANRWHTNLYSTGGSDGLGFTESGVADFRLFLAPGGNVGFGINTPSRTLDVNGNARVRGLTTAGMVTTDASGNLSSAAIPASQTLAISGQTLSISSGNSVTLPSGGSPSGTAGGSLTGTYPNPTLAANAVTNAALADDAVGIAELSATGTASSSTFLRGDNTWSPLTSAAWGLAGNTLNGSQFIGSLNDEDFVVRRNNTEAFRVYGNGRVSLGNNSPASSSVMLGFNAGATLSTGTYNTFVGSKAGETNNASNNTLVGFAAGQQATDYDNTMLGFYAGNQVSGGSNNVFIGSKAANLNTASAVGGGNVVIGAGAGTTLGSGSNNNILIGTSSQATAGLSNAYAIGNGASVTQGSSLVIGTNRGTAGAVSVGIGTSAPTSSLQVNGTFAVGVVNNYGGGGDAAGANSFDQGVINATSLIGGYYGLNPTTSSNQYYKLPAASACPGRIYYLRNNSPSLSAFLVTAGGSIYGAGSASAVSSTTGYEMKPTTTSKTVIAISDGTNWTVGTLN